MTVNETDHLRERVKAAVELATLVAICPRQHCPACTAAAAFFLGNESEKFAQAYAAQHVSFRQALELIAAGAADDPQALAAKALKKIQP